MVWAYYSAYESIVMHYVVQVKLFENGLGDKFLETKEITKLVRIALPHQENFINEHGVNAFGHLLDELENRLLLEIDKMLKGHTESKESVEKAAEIQRYAENVMDSTKN